MSTTDNNDITSESEGLRGQARPPFEWKDDAEITVIGTVERTIDWASLTDEHGRIYYEDISSHRTRTNRR